MRWHTHPRMAGTGDRLDGHHGRVAQIILQFHRNPSVDLLRAALTHDVGEMIVGDIPSGMKRDMPDVAERHARVESVSRDTIAGAFPDLSANDETCLRWADRYDAYLWAQHNGEDMQSKEWRLALEEIARLEHIISEEVQT